MGTYLAASREHKWRTYQQMAQFLGLLSPGIGGNQRNPSHKACLPRLFCLVGENLGLLRRTLWVAAFPVQARAAQRTRLLARQVEELQRSRTEAAGAAASAAEQIQFFRSQVEELTAREAEAREALAEAADRVEALLQQLDELRRRERDARAGVAFSVERKEALQEELDRMRQKNDSLAEALQAGKADVAVAEERARQLSVQLERVKALEEAAREMASTMQLKAETLATTVVELEKRAAESQEHAQSLDTQLQIALRKVQLPPPPPALAIWKAPLSFLRSSREAAAFLRAAEAST